MSEANFQFGLDVEIIAMSGVRHFLAVERESYMAILIYIT